MQGNEIKLKNFKRWSPSFKFLFFPMLLMGIFALAVFILTSFWKYDLLSAKFFAQGMKYLAVKYWTQLYAVAGVTEIMVALFILVMILIESFFKKQIEKKSNGFYSKNRWILMTIYLLIFALWIGINIYQIVAYGSKDTGFGPGVDHWILDSSQITQSMRIFSFLFQSIFLVGGSYYVHYKLVKQKQFWKQAFWIDAIKGLTFFAISYLLVVFLKGMLSRPYYYNYIFGDLLDQLRAEGKSDWVQNYLNQTHFKYGFNQDGFWANNIPGAWPWWKANGFFKSQPNMPQFDSWTNYAFPSGHVNATYCVGTVFFLFVGKDRKLNWGVKLVLGIFFLHLLAMSFALVTMRGHWLSDLSFSHLWALILLPTVNLVINKIFQKNQKNKKQLSQKSKS